MNLEEYRLRYQNTDAGPGWEAIDARVNAIYSSQEPKHFAPTPHYALGGNDPLDGISIYESSVGGLKHHHFVTYGFSELYFNEAAFGKEFSKFGFELTFRLGPYLEGEETPFWVLNLLQNIARYVFKSGNGSSRIM